MKIVQSLLCCFRAVPSSLGTQFNHCRSPFSLRSLLLNEDQTRWFPTRGAGREFAEAKPAVGAEPSRLLWRQETASAQGHRSPRAPRRLRGTRKTSAQADPYGFHITSLSFSAGVYKLQDHKYLAHGYHKLFGLFGQIFTSCKFSPFMITSKLFTSPSGRTWDGCEQMLIHPDNLDFGKKMKSI